VNDTLDRGPLKEAVLRVALPATAFQLLVFANNFVDYLWVKQLGDQAASGQTAGWTVFWMLASLGQIFSTGVTAVVARRVGERRPSDATHAATQGFKGALLGGLLVGGLGWLLVPHLARLNAATPRAAAYTVDYLGTLAAGSPVIFAYYAFEGTFKGHGDMRRPLRALTMAVLLNAVLDPLLIHVAGLEVLGAALATVVAFLVTTLALASAAWRRGWMRWAGPRLDARLVGRVLRIGFPISLHGILFSAVYVFIVRETNLAGGDTATAALGLGLRFEGFAFMASVGFATAAAALVGQNLGAGEVRRAHDGAWTSVRLAAWISGLWGVLFLLLPLGAVEVLAPSRAAAVHALDYFHIVAMSMVFTAAEIVLEGAFSGAGDTKPAYFLAIPMTLARIPVAMFASRTLGWGVAGVFWALTWTSVARGLLFLFWFARGRWVHGRA
jgi:putative MATE family efflux protein